MCFGRKGFPIGAAAFLSLMLHLLRQQHFHSPDRWRKLRLLRRVFMGDKNVHPCAFWTAAARRSSDSGRHVARKEKLRLSTPKWDVRKLRWISRCHPLSECTHPGVQTDNSVDYHAPTALNPHSMNHQNRPPCVHTNKSVGYKEKEARQKSTVLLVNH